MSSTGYKLLGFAVWRGGRWYLRRRYRPRGAALAGLLLAGTLAVGGAALARRIAG